MEWSGDRAVRRLAEWIEKSGSPQQVGGRYRKALSTSYVDRDEDYTMLWDARVGRLASLKKLRALAV